MGAGAGEPIRVRFPIKGPLGISFSASDAASPPLISAISETGLAATVRGLEVGMALVSVQGRSVEHAGFDAAITAIKHSSRPLELEFAPPGGGEADNGSFGSTSSAGFTELMQAAAIGQDATVAALRNGADLDAQDSDGWTALHHACHAGEKGSVEELVRAGCAVDVEDDTGETPADIAENAGRSDLVGLLQQRARPGTKPGSGAGVSSGDSQIPAASHDTARLERELRHAKAEVADLQTALATERRCIQTLTDQAHVGRDEALATLLDELELARTQLSVSQRQQRELDGQLQGCSSKEEHEKTRLRLRQVEQVLSGMEEQMADATRREEELEISSKVAEAERKAAVDEAAASRAEAEALDAKCREQATKLQQLRRRQSAQKETAMQEQQRVTEEALAEGAAGWEAQYREQAELVDTQGRKLRELSRQLAEHRVSKENTMREAETLRAENAQLRKTVSALETDAKDHTAERRKAEQLQRTLNSERERAQAAVAARNEQHELEVNAMKEEFAKLLEQRDKQIAKLTKQSSSDGKHNDDAMPTKNARMSNGAARGKSHRPRAAKAAGVTTHSGNPRQSPRRARAHAPARTSRSSPVTVTPVEDMATTNAPVTPKHSRAKKLLEQAENYERKTQGIGREIKRIGRDTRRQQRQLSPEGPSAHDRRLRSTTGSRRSVSASPAKRRLAVSSPVARAGSAGTHDHPAPSDDRSKRPSGSPARYQQLSLKAEKQVERLYVNDVERREQWRAQALADQEAAEAKQVRATSRRRPVKGDEIDKRWLDIQGAQRRKAEWVAAEKLKEEEMEEKELEQHWVMSKGSAAGGKYHIEDGRDVGTRTQAWHTQKKAELQRKERELKRTQRQQERGSLGVPAMAKKSKAYTKDLNSDVIMRNEQFAEQRSAKIADAKTTREEEQAKKRKETVTLSKTSANLVSQGRHKGTDVISRNEAFNAARLERLAAAEYAQKKPTTASRPAHDPMSDADSLEPVSPERALSPVGRSSHQRCNEQTPTPEEDSFARNEREALMRSADNERSPSRAYSRAATFASSIVGEERKEHDSEAPDSVRRTPPPAMRAGSTGSVFRRGRASKQRQAPSRRMSLSPAASRSSSAGDTTAVAFGSTFSPKPDARMDELESPRSVVSLRRGSVHSDVAASGTHEKPLAVGRRSPLGSRRPRQDSPVERSLRAARGEDSTPELAADAQKMREEIASLKGMWDKLETVADEGSIKSSSAAGPDENDYW